MSLYNIIQENIDKLDWSKLSSNPNAIPFLEQNIDKINWDSLSSNPNAIHLLEQNLDKINWRYLSFNPKPLFIKWRQNIEKNIYKKNFELFLK